MSRQPSRWTVRETPLGVSRRSWFGRNSRSFLAVIAIAFFAREQAVAAADPKSGKGEGFAPGSVRGNPPGDYVLQPQDVLRVQVFQEDDINKQGEVSISLEHTIVLPLINTVNLKGKTARQAETLIRDLYDKDFLVNPSVTVSVLKYAERSVSVTGQVNAAGRIRFPPEGGLTIVGAITEAGGQTRLADLRRVKLTRKNASGDSVTQEINVDAMMNGGAEPVTLEKGDVILVPERRI